MKTLVAIIITLTVCLGLRAQGNLQFNQVLYLSNTTDNQTQWTVPAGKVWKIEALGVVSSTLTVYINNAVAFYYAGTYSNSSTSGYYRNADASPIWLPAGSILGHNCGCGNRWFSIIEFNIVP
jgi:hypothetical protein